MVSMILVESMMKFLENPMALCKDDNVFIRHVNNTEVLFEGTWVYNLEGTRSGVH